MSSTSVQPRGKRPASPSSSTSTSKRRGVRWKSSNERRTYNVEDAPNAGDESHDEEVMDSEAGDEDEVDGLGDGPRREKELTRDSRILSLHAPYGTKLGAAFYDDEKRVLHVLEDTKDTVGWDLATLLMEQWTPTLVLMSSKAQDPLVDRVEEYCTQHNIICELQPYKSFTQNYAVNRLASLRLAGNRSALQFNDEDAQPQASGSSNGHLGSDHTATSAGFVDRMAKYRPDPDEYAGMGKLRLSLVKLGCWTNVDVPMAVSATGGLLTYLAKQIAADTDCYENVEVPVTHIESMQLDQHMLINLDALTSLGVLNHYEHSPTSDRDKKSNSIFNLLKTTVTPLGHKLMHAWHLRPLANIDLINERHETVEVLGFVSNQDACADVTKALRQIRNIPIHLRRLSRGRGGHKEWRALVDALVAGTQAREILIDMPGALPLQITKRVKEMITFPVIEFERKVIEIIDFDVSAQEDRPCVRAGVDRKLDALFMDYQSECYSAVTTEVADRLREQIFANIELDIAAQYIPSLGFLVCIAKTEYEVQVPHEWDLTFESEETRYYRTRETQLLNADYGDLDSEIQSRESEIIQDLIEDLKLIQKQIENMMEIVAELDW